MIEKETTDGMTAGKIRLLRGLTCSSDTLYATRRKALTKIKKDEMCNMLNEKGQWTNWTYIIFKDRNIRFCYSYSFNEPVINSFCNSICVIDDTACNNFYGYPLLMVISVDENNNNQILCFSLLPNKTIKSFSKFLEELKNRIGDVNAFLTDRCISQIAAIKEIWLNTHIIYCSIHVERNIKIDCNEVMFKLYQKMKLGALTNGFDFYLN